MFSTTDKLYNTAQPLKNDTVKSAHVYRKEAHNMLSKKIKLLSDIYNMIPFYHIFIYQKQQKMGK